MSGFVSEGADSQFFKQLLLQFQTRFLFQSETEAKKLATLLSSFCVNFSLVTNALPESRLGLPADKRD